MMIAPAQASGPTVIDLVAQATRLWSQLLLAPLTWAAPTPAVVPVEPPVPAPPIPPAAQLIALAVTDEPITNHALLMLLGHFAQPLGLLELLSAVPVDQKTVTHALQTKRIEFLLAILAGLEQLQELNDAAAPLAHASALAQAWGQPAFAHYSGVSRTLAAADDDTVQAVLSALAQVSQPCIDREVMALLHTQRPLMIDIDLTGRPVSPTSTTCRKRLVIRQRAHQGS